jgi:hypothetical protein
MSSEAMKQELRDLEQENAGLRHEVTEAALARIEKVGHARSSMLLRIAERTRERDDARQLLGQALTLIEEWIATLHDENTTIDDVWPRAENLLIRTGRKPGPENIGYDPADPV